MKRLFLIVFASVALLAGCSSSSSTKGLQALDFGMSPDQVREQMGAGYTMVASSVNTKGQKVTAWKYQSDEKSPATMVYFVDDKLVRWGNAAELENLPELGLPASSK